MKTANSSKPRDQIRAMIELAARQLPERVDQYDLELDNLGDIPEALDLYRRAVVQHQAAAAVRKACGVHLAELLGEGGAACYGDQIVRYRRGSMETCIDTPAALAALSKLHLSGDIDLATIINPNNLKRTGMPPAYRDTFFHRVDDAEPSLSEMPRGKAPKFLADMTDGDVRTAT